MRKNAITLFASFLFLILTNNLFAATYYVSPSGNNTNDGSVGNPWLTIQGAIDQAVVVNGDIIIVKDGTYTENVNITKSVILQSENGYLTTNVVSSVITDKVFEVQASDVTIDGFTVYGSTGGSSIAAAVSLTTVNNCTITNNRIGYDASHKSYRGILMSNSDNNLISSNICNYNQETGIDISTGSDNNTIQNNTSSDNGYGIVNSGASNTLRSNTIEQNTNFGIYILAGTADLGANDTNDKGKNTIRNNGSYDVFNGTVTATNAYYNYWGITDGPTIDSHIRDNEEGGGEVFFDPWLAGPPGPEMDLKQSTTDIPDGGSYDYGDQALGTDTDVVFTIENTGTEDLTLTTPLTLDGADAGQFSVQADPASPVASGGGTTTFTVRFSPTSTGAKIATIAIANNDSNENPYDLTLNGNGIECIPGSLIYNTDTGKFNFCENGVWVEK